VVGTTIGGRISSSRSRRTWNHGGRLSVVPSFSGDSSTVKPGPSVAISNRTPPG